MTKIRLKAFMAAAVMAAMPAQADERSVADKWAEVEANAVVFREAAARLGFTSSWQTPAPIRLSLLPPATEREIAVVERQMGERLPDSLRTFFLEASAGVDIFWLVPGEMVVREGLTSVEYALLPPAPWTEISQPLGPDSAREVPKINGGVLTFGLEAMLGNRSRAKPWARRFREEAEAASDPGEIAHFNRYADFWDDALPLAFDGGGDVLAVSRSDPENRLVFLFHDGSDEPGWFLEQSLIDFMVTQSRLGFPGIGVSEFIAFRDTGVVGGEMAAAYAEIHGGEAERLGLAMPTSIVIGVDAPDADIWRGWLGL